MTEQEWLECADPTPMLEFLRGTASERKLRLFACACCRRIWHLLPHAAARVFVEVAEQYADQLASDVELAKADDEHCLAQIDVDYKWGPVGTEYAMSAVECAGHRDG